MEYFYRKSKKKHKAHIWNDDSSDTYCKMWSTGGLKKSLDWRKSEIKGDRDVCTMCANKVTDKPDFRKYRKGNTVFMPRFGQKCLKEITLDFTPNSKQEIISSPITDDFLDKHNLQVTHKEPLKRKYLPTIMLYYFFPCDEPFSYKHEIENYFNLI